MFKIKKNTNGKILFAGGKILCLCCTPLGLLAKATSAGTGTGCEMGPAVQTYYIPPPYLLIAGQTYRLQIGFDSGDGLYHVGSYYEANFVPSPQISLNWQTEYLGTIGDPWSISNNGNTIRFTLDDSENCGGNNPDRQFGFAVATITPEKTISLGFSFSGIAELASTNFENIEFYLLNEPSI